MNTHWWDWPIGLVGGLLLAALWIAGYLLVMAYVPAPAHVPRW